MLNYIREISIQSNFFRLKHNLFRFIAVARIFYRFALMVSKGQGKFVQHLYLWLITLVYFNENSYLSWIKTEQLLSLELEYLPPLVVIVLISLDVIPNQARAVKIGAAISNSFGFGGQNGVLVFSKA